MTGMMTRGGQHTPEMRAKIAERTKASLAGRIVRARMSYLAKQAWTPERRAAQRERFLRMKETLVIDADEPMNFEEHRLKKLKEKQESAEHRAKLRANLVRARNVPNHPYGKLPQMTPKERNKYRYLRRMTSRENALAVIMADREAA